MTLIGKRVKVETCDMYVDVIQGNGEHLKKYIKRPYYATIENISYEQNKVFVVGDGGKCAVVGFEDIIIKGDTDKEASPANKKISGAIKTSIYVSVICPECNNVMRNGSFSCHCVNPECKLYKDEYLFPQVILERIGK